MAQRKDKGLFHPGEPAHQLLPAKRPKSNPRTAYTLSGDQSPEANDARVSCVSGVCSGVSSAVLGMFKWWRKKLQLGTCSGKTTRSPIGMNRTWSSIKWYHSTSARPCAVNWVFFEKQPEQLARIRGPDQTQKHGSRVQMQSSKASMLTYYLQCPLNIRLWIGVGGLFFLWSFF